MKPTEFRRRLARAYELFEHVMFTTYDVVSDAEQQRLTEALDAFRLALRYVTHSPDLRPFRCNLGDRASRDHLYSLDRIEEYLHSCIAAAAKLIPSVPDKPQVHGGFTAINTVREICSTVQPVDLEAA